MFLLLGVGANGKTTFVEIVRCVLGDSAHQADVATFLDRLQQGGPRNGVAGLCGMRFVTSSEIGENRRLNESLMKTLTGSEPISASRIYEREFEFHPTFKIWIAANHKPVIRGADEGIWRRLRLVPFTANIAPDKQDHHLREKLEMELPGILAWAVQGCLAWQKEGLGEPATVTVATKQFRDESDEIGQFIEARCKLDAEASEPAGALYTAYVAWCAQNALEAVTQTKFGRNLTDRGIPRMTDKAGARLSLRMGIALEPEKTGDHAGTGERVTVGEGLSLSTHKERDMEVTIEETRSNSLNPLADTLSESLEADQYELAERAGMAHG
jgi:putative DNA primase/helicase